MPNSSPRSLSFSADSARQVIIRLTFTLLLLSCSETFAQTTTGAIEGFVTGPDGNPLADIVVVVTRPATSVTRSAVTTGHGLYRITALPLGEYEVAIQDPGYQPVTVKPVIVRLGWTTAVPTVQLIARGELVEHVEVKGRPPVIDPVSTTSGGTVQAGFFDNLPVQRNYQSIATLLPGVSRSFLGDDLNIDGATGMENRYFVDGIDMTNPVNGMGGTVLPPDFIQEVQVKTGGYEAEYRSALGGIVNVVTPTGSNQFAGKFIGYWTSHVVSEDARQSPLQLQQRNYAQYDAGFSLSGPLVRDRAWFFVAYDPEYQTVETEIPGLGYYDGSTTTHRFAGKLDWQVNPANRLTLTVAGDPSKEDNVGDIGVPLGLTPVTFLNPDPWLREIETGSTGVALRGTHVLGPNVLLETALSNLWQESKNNSATSNSDILFIDTETGTWSGGSFGFLETSNSQLTVGVKATWAPDGHEFKAGAEYRYNRMWIDGRFANIYRYSDSFYSDVHVSTDELTAGNRIPSLFVQDSWRIGSQLTINYGLRWSREEFIDASGSVNQTIDDEWQPRAGFVWQPGRPGSQRIYGSAGRYYQEVATLALNNYEMGGAFALLCNYDHDPRLDPAGGDCSSLIPSAPQPEIPDLRGDYHDYYSLGYQRRLGDRHRAGIRATYRSLGDTIDDGLVTATGTFVWANPGRGPLAADYPRASRVYKALELTFEGQPSARSGYLASYVWSENRGNYMGLFNSDIQTLPTPNYGSFDLPEQLIDADGLLPNDRTHVFKASGYYMFEFGLNIGASLLWESGTPLNEFGSSTWGVLYYTFLQQRGSAGRTPSIFDLSLRLDYTFRKNSAARWKPRLILDVYHLFSNETPVDYDQVHYLGQDESGNQIYPSPTYGMERQYYPPLTARLGFELSF